MSSRSQALLRTSVLNDAAAPFGHPGNTFCLSTVERAVRSAAHHALPTLPPSSTAPSRSAPTTSRVAGAHRLWRAAFYTGRFERCPAHRQRRRHNVLGLARLSVQRRDRDNCRLRHCVSHGYIQRPGCLYHQGIRSQFQRRWRSSTSRNDPFTYGSSSPTPAGMCTICSVSYVRRSALNSSTQIEQCGTLTAPASQASDGSSCRLLTAQER